MKEAMASMSTSALELAAQLEAKYPNLEILKYKSIAPLQIMLRDKNSTHAQFKHYADRLMRYSTNIFTGTTNNK
jgi:hypothetical protein